LARVENSILGFLSGKLGDFVFRKMNGKKFMSCRARKYKISQSAEAKKGRANFAAAVKFAITVNSIPEVKKAWSSAKTEGTNSYHRIIKYNSKRVNSGKLTTANKITPDGLPLTLSSLLLKGDNELELNISFPDDKINFPALLCLVFIFNNDMILKQNLNIDWASEIPLKVALNNEIVKRLKKFPCPIVYSAVLGNKVNNDEIFWTSTAARQIKTPGA
jgi:hypothetical protein